MTCEMESITELVIDYFDPAHQDKILDQLIQSNKSVTLERFLKINRGSIILPAMDRFLPSLTAGDLRIASMLLKNKLIPKVTVEDHIVQPAFKSGLLNALRRQEYRELKAVCNLTHLTLDQLESKESSVQDIIDELLLNNIKNNNLEKIQQAWGYFPELMDKHLNEKITDYCKQQGHIKIYKFLIQRSSNSNLIESKSVLSAESLKPAIAKFAQQKKYQLISEILDEFKDIDLSGASEIIRDSLLRDLNLDHLKALFISLPHIFYQIINFPNSQAITILLQCMYQDDLAMVKFLASKQVNFLVFTELEKSSLFVAFKKRNVELINLILNGILCSKTNPIEEIKDIFFNW